MIFELDTEYFFVHNGKIRSEKILKINPQYITFQSNVRRAKYNIFKTEGEAVERLHNAIINSISVLGIKSIQELRETINYLETFPEYMI